MNWRFGKIMENIFVLLFILGFLVLAGCLEYLVFCVYGLVGAIVVGGILLCTCGLAGIDGYGSVN